MQTTHSPRATAAGHSGTMKAISAALMAAVISGCSTIVTYSPQTANAEGKVCYTQGVGALVIQKPDHELYMYPTYKTQGPAQPTFTIGYANGSEGAVNFGLTDIKAYFLGVPIPIYSYNEKVAEIRRNHEAAQAAMLMLGILAAGAIAYAASHQTYTTNYSGAVRGRGGVTTWSGSSTMRVYDPMSGILAGAAVAGGAALAVPSHFR